MHYAPWWLLLLCLPVAGMAAYLALRGTDLSRRTLYALTILLSPVLVVGAAAVAVVLSTALFAFLEPTSEPSVLPARTEPSTPEPTRPAPEETVPEPTSPTSSPAASPSASPTASPAASPAASSASPAAGE